MIWLDAHLSPRIAQWIEAQFQVPARPVRELGLRHAEDEAIWHAAREAGAIILTKDADFAERVIRLGPPPQVLWLTCGNTSEDQLKHLLAVQLAGALQLLQHGEPLVEIQ